MRAAMGMPSCQVRTEEMAYGRGRARRRPEITIKHELTIVKICKIQRLDDLGNLDEAFLAIDERFTPTSTYANEGVVMVQ